MLCSCDRLFTHPSNASSGEKDENSFFRIFLLHVPVGAASLDRIKAKQLEANAELQSETAVWQCFTKEKLPKMAKR